LAYKNNPPEETTDIGIKFPPFALNMTGRDSTYVVVPRTVVLNEAEKAGIEPSKFISAYSVMYTYKWDGTLVMKFVKKEG